MIATLAAALSLAASVAIDVPYLPQTDALCGGAAAAMVFRYWGDVHADPQEFAPLVDRRAGGIANGVLVDGVRRRGWRTVPLAGGLAGLESRLASHEPVVVLLADRGARYHYVVAVGQSADTVTIHDPSWGPSREIKKVEFDRLWRASGHWGLVILPPLTTSAPDQPPSLRTDGGQSMSSCDEWLSRALDDIRQAGYDEAEAILAPIRTACPTSAGPWRELAGVRFAQRRWKDATTLARDALARDSNDQYAVDVLGSSLFMQDDDLGALRAWNQIDKPRVNLVRIAGVHRTRHQAVAAALGIQPNMLLTAETFDRARHRLDELPDRSTARLALRPEADGFASVDVVLLERNGTPRNAFEWTAAGAQALVTRSVTASLPGGSGNGELWSAKWSFWRNRPRVGMAFAAPRAGGFPGVWRVEASWDAESFAANGTSAFAPLKESRLHGALTISDWVSARFRYSLNTGLDVWNGDRHTAAIGGAIERRWFGDRAALEAHATDWFGVGSSRSFQAAGLQLRVRSSPDPRRWIMLGTAGVDRVSNDAPLGLWPGAGEGQARAPLLRAHPLIEDGVIALGSAAAFGRSLSYASAEAQRWFDRPALARVGIAAFVDVARAARRAAGDASPAHVDIGAGMRLRMAGAPGALRVDIARGIRDGAGALTVGWQF